MASVEARREKVTNEGVNLVEKDKVPKIATHFESLAGKARNGESESERKRREEGPKREGVGLVGKVKDEAVVVGWGTTQYTLEKVGEATKAMASITSSVAGEKVVVAKDMVADAGKTAVRYAGDKIAATTAEEKAAEYAATKQAEARSQLEASHSYSNEIVKEEEEEEEESKEQREAPPEKFMGMCLEDEQGGILEAIGETILEIGQTTKAFLLGFNPIQHKDEPGFTEDH